MRQDSLGERGGGAKIQGLGGGPRGGTACGLRALAVETLHSNPETLNLRWVSSVGFRFRVPGREKERPGRRVNSCYNISKIGSYTTANALSERQKNIF